jgi:hypothetical protein
MKRIYNADQIQWLKDNIHGCHFRELTDKFNEHFGMNLKVSTMISLTDRHGLHNGIDCRLNTGYVPTQFRKGHVPANKGKKGIGGWEPTQFRKGNKPANWVPVGTERINVDGYTEIKIQDGKLNKNWKAKHVHIWENENGPVPESHVIIFGDGNKCNFDINNLILISRQQLSTLNKKHLIQKDADLTRSAIIIVDITHKITDRTKNKKGTKS